MAALKRLTGNALSHTTWVCGQVIQFTLTNEIQINIPEKLI